MVKCCHQALRLALDGGDSRCSAVMVAATGAGAGAIVGVVGVVVVMLVVAAQGSAGLGSETSRVEICEDECFRLPMRAARKPNGRRGVWPEARVGDVVVKRGGRNVGCSASLMQLSHAK